MSRPITIAGEFAVAWTANQLGKERADFGAAEGIGVHLDGTILAGVIYNNWIPEEGGGSICASIAATSPKWCTRNVLARLMAYPFLQLGCHRLWVMQSRKNKKARNFVERLGFKFEGVARKGWDVRTDAMIFSMLRSECRYIDGVTLDDLRGDVVNG